MNTNDYYIFENMLLSRYKILIEYMIIQKEKKKNLKSIYGGLCWLCWVFVFIVVIFKIFISFF